MRFLILTGLLFFLILSSFKSYSQEGSIDLSFGVAGKVLTAFGTTPDNANAVSIQPDGKIVVAGFAYFITGYEFAVARYNSDGTMDSTFGTNGKATKAFTNKNAFGYCMALQDDGKIVVGGYVHDFNQHDFAIARFLNNGVSDPSFGYNGTFTTDFAFQDDRIFGISLLSDDRILAIGNSTDNGIIHKFALAQYLQNGFPDYSFGNMGKTTTEFEGGLAYGKSVVFQSDGKCIVAGYSYNSQDSDYDFAAARYETSGTIDSTFGTNGKLTTNFGLTDHANSIGLQPDGKFVLGGGSGNNSGASRIAISRYNVNGQLDSSFGINGKVITNSSPSITATAVVIAQNGKLNVAGYGNGSDFLIAQYLPNGTIDQAFGVNGITFTDFGGEYDFGRSIALQNDGKIIVAGTVTAPLNGRSNFATARFSTSISLPVSLISFYCRNTINSIMLHWSVGQEVNSAYYSIERSSNGIDFTGIAKVKSKDNVNIRYNYQYEDLLPFMGYNYYRLKQVDINGNYTYFNTVKSVFSKNNIIRIFPNPVQNDLKITGLDAQYVTTLEIINSSGAVILSSNTKNTSIAIDSHQLLAGVYVVKIINGNTITNLSFMKE